MWAKDYIKTHNFAKNRDREKEKVQFQIFKVNAGFSWVAMKQCYSWANIAEHTMNDRKTATSPSLLGAELTISHH